MALEQLRAEIEMLVQQMADEPEDIHELHARIRSKLNEIKAMGMPLPDDLVALERQLDQEESTSAGRAQARTSKGEGVSAPRSRAGRSAKRAKRPAKAAKKTVSRAAKSKRGANKTARTARGSSVKKAKRPPARAAKKSRSSGVKKARRGGRRGR
jgi:hypothetical protein